MFLTPKRLIQKDIQVSGNDRALVQSHVHGLREPFGVPSPLTEALPGPGTLADAHGTPDAAVAAAYARTWPPSENALRTRRRVLNLECAGVKQ